MTNKLRISLGSALLFTLFSSACMDFTAPDMGSDSGVPGTETDGISTSPSGPHFVKLAPGARADGISTSPSGPRP